MAGQDHASGASQVQNRILRPILSGQGERSRHCSFGCSTNPLLRRLPAYAAGIGARPEHIETPEFADTK